MGGLCVQKSVPVGPILVPISTEWLHLFLDDYLVILCCSKFSTSSFQYLVYLTLVILFTMVLNVGLFTYLLLWVPGNFAMNARYLL